MAASTALNRDERFGLALAVLAHAALIWFLVVYKPAIPVPPPPERMTVTISEEVGPTATSPEPQAVPQQDKGPELGDSPPPPVPVEQASPEPQPRPVVTPPKPVPAPAPVPKAVPRPPAPAPKPAPQQRAATPPAKPAPRATGKPGSSAFDHAFSAGIPAGKPAGRSINAPAPATGQMKSTWASFIGSKVQRYWDSCPVNGLEVEKLRVVARFTLATDGSIQSLDDVTVDPATITSANRSQVAPFKACAIKAIKLAAPFKGLPPEYYNDWKTRVLRLRKE